MKPLQNVNVISLATNVPGPAAVAHLARLGAAVVKIEPPWGDALALACPGWYAELHQDIEVRLLDLKQDAGRAVLGELLEGSDLFITATRPSALERLGLDWPSLAGRYPRLCQVAIIGYPPPNEEQAGHDLTYQAGLGLVDPPHLPRTLVADLAGAERAVIASLSLMLNRLRAERDGQVLNGDARCVQVSLSEAVDLFAEPLRHGMTADGGLLAGGLPGYNVYRAEEGWVAIAALEPHFLRRLADELALDEVSQAALAEIFLSRPADQWEAWAIQRDLPILALRSPG